MSEPGGSGDLKKLLDVKWRIEVLDGAVTGIEWRSSRYGLFNLWTINLHQTSMCADRPRGMRKIGEDWM